MTKKINKVTGDISTMVAGLEARVTVLEKQVQKLASQRVKVRKVRVFTDEQRAAIRGRLLAGQEVARKQREAEHKAKPNGKAKENKKVVSPAANESKIGNTAQ
jgi:small-conductance mechanosensitive channel